MSAWTIQFVDYQGCYDSGHYGDTDTAGFSAHAGHVTCKAVPSVSVHDSSIK